jgi:N-acetylneuraminic acid mutarotase
VFAVLVLMMLLQLISTVGAAKLRRFRDVSANVWAEGKPSARASHAMAAGPDGSLYVFGGDLSAASTTPSAEFDNVLFKLDLDTKEWHILEPRGSVKPSARRDHCMVAVGDDLYVFGGFTTSGSSNELFRFSTTKLLWEKLDAPQVLGSQPSERTRHGMASVGSDLYVFGGVGESQWARR